MYTVEQLENPQASQNLLVDAVESLKDDVRTRMPWQTQYQASALVKAALGNPNWDPKALNTTLERLCHGIDLTTGKEMLAAAGNNLAWDFWLMGFGSLVQVSEYIDGGQRPFWVPLLAWSRVLWGGDIRVLGMLRGAPYRWLGTSDQSVSFYPIVARKGFHEALFFDTPEYLIAVESSREDGTLTPSFTLPKELLHRIHQHPYNPNEKGRVWEDNPLAAVLGTLQPISDKRRLALGKNYPMLHPFKFEGHPGGRFSVEPPRRVARVADPK